MKTLVHQILGSLQEIFVELHPRHIKYLISIMIEEGNIHRLNFCSKQYVGKIKETLISFHFNIHLIASAISIQKISKG